MYVCMYAIELLLIRTTTLLVGLGSPGSGMYVRVLG